MEDKTIAAACACITALGLIIFALFYQDEFRNTTISEFNSAKEISGLLNGKVETIIQTYPSTLFVLNDGNKATIYYPKPYTKIKKNQYLKVYAAKRAEDGGRIYAYKLVEE